MCKIYVADKRVNMEDAPECENVAGMANSEPPSEARSEFDGAS